MPEKPAAPAPGVEEARTADTQDGGWSVESHSAPDTPPPLDTTIEPQGIDNPPLTAVAPPPAADVVDDDADLDDDEPPVAAPARAAAAPAARDTEGKFAKPKSKKRLRYEELDRARHDAERRADDLSRRLEALEKKPVAPARAADKPVETPAAAPIPEHPRYADFQTDDEFNAAVTKWRTVDMPKWQADHEARLKADITSGVDARFDNERQTAAEREHQAGVSARLVQMRGAHPDFDEKIAAGREVLADIKHPFLNDMIENTPDGAEFLYDLASEPAMAQALGDLPLPTRPLADAVRSSPAARTLLKHFATDEGREDFLRLRTLHPIQCLLEVGKLSALLDTADRGPVPRATHPITNAAPPAKPPVGTPRARDVLGSGAPPAPFDEWMIEEDKREAADKRKRLGLSASA